MKRLNPDIDSEKSTSRIINLSDAVFAVAITLLVVQIPIPVKAPDRELGDNIVDSIPMFISFAISFAVISLLWLKHLQFNHHIRRYSVKLIWLNFMFLMVICFLPFPTGVYGTHSGDEVALILYAVTIAAAGYLSVLMWLVVFREPGLMHADIDMGEVRRSLKISLVIPVIFTLSIPVSYIYIPIVPYIWTLAAVLLPVIKYGLLREKK